MPVEIKELHIRVTVNAAEGSSSNQQTPGPGKNSDADRQAIIAECVEQVLDILQNKSER
ncbi:MAG: DUF5908 family protein [Chlorobiaceae bacterium]|jgi:Family of unknown function (DUF5908)